MSSQHSRPIYYLENNQGQAVRAIEWEEEKLHFIFRHDTQRVEAIYDLGPLVEENISFTLLETLDKQRFSLNKRYPLSFMNNHISLVAESKNILRNVDLPKDDPDHFIEIFKKTSGIMVFLVAFLLIGSILIPNINDHIKNADPLPLQTVTVIDRKLVPPSLVVKPLAIKPSALVQQAPKRIILPRKFSRSHLQKKQIKPIAITQLGALGALGQLKKSPQRGGLSLNHFKTSKGIGRGEGLEGSGGIQTSHYAKGMFSAPLGTGKNIYGGGGYGSKGKGGGASGYGKMALVGSSSSSTAFIESIDSEAWSQGGLDKNAIAAVIQRHLSEVRFCYENSLQKNPNLSGRVSINFTIGQQGLVTLAQVNNSSMGHPPVENCIRDHLRSWKFPKPQGGVNVKVNYPFVLRRVSDT